MEEKSVSKGCDEKFVENRLAPDPRLRVVLLGNMIRYKWQDMNHVIAKEICERLALVIRMGDIFAANALPSFRIKEQEVGVQVQIQFEEWLPDKTVCVVWEPRTRAVRAVVSGMDAFEACMLLSSAAAEIQREIDASTTDVTNIPDNL